MRQRILTLGLILVARTLFAQEALTLDPTVPGHTGTSITAPVSGNAWIDLRQNAKPGAVQSAPDWVEAVTFIPAGTQADAAAPSVVRVRLARPGERALAGGQTGRERIWYRDWRVFDGFDSHRLDIERICYLRVRVGIATLGCPQHFRDRGPAN